MQVAATNRQVTSSGVTAKATFGISQRSAAHIMTILRDTLYTDKVLAVLREYASNAWDSHRQSGIPDKPIKVTLPTFMLPTLIIRDFGAGMSQDQVLNVYTQYGESTKRDDDISVGMMGIGSKSGFAYSDTFMITSWNGGTKSVYVAVLDASDEGEINKLHEEPCGDETGLEIQISVRPTDIYEFERKARNLFPYFNPLPEINLTLPTTNRKIKEHGFFTETEDGWIAVMGCIPYKIDINQIQPELEAAGIWDTLQKTKGGLYFEIGEVQISASREELKYSSYTKKAMLEKFKLLIECYIEEVLETLRQDDVSNWAKRSQAVFMQQFLKIRIPKKYAEWSEHNIRFFHAADPNDPKSERHEAQTFFLWKDNATNSHVAVSESTKFLIKDDNRNIKGFQLKSHDYLVRPIKRMDGTEASQEEIRSELDAIIADNRMEGVPIKLLSEIPWYKPQEDVRRESRIANPKHQVRAFKLLTDCSDGGKGSDNWEIAKWDPADEDVYVIISGFKVAEHEHFYRTYQDDKKAAAMLGAVMPPIYGYKNTEKKPVLHTDCKGMFYFTWRKEFFKKLVNTPQILALMQHKCWNELIPDAMSDSRGREIWYALPSLVTKLTKDLGADHPFVKMVGRHVEARKVIRANTLDLTVLGNWLNRTGIKIEYEATAAKEKIMKHYPMIGLTGLYPFKDHTDQMIEYIIMVDLLSPATA